MNEEINLPNGWETVSIESVTFNQKGKKPKRLEAKYFSGSCPYLDIRALEHSEIQKYADEESSNIIDENDVAIVWDGARSGWVLKGKEGALGSTLVRLKPFLFSQQYLYHFLSSKFLYINNNTKGTGIPHVDPLILWSIKMPFAPLNEQNRVVAKIEELFSGLDNGIQNLKLAQKQLKVYCQALLKYTFEGKLTEQWRKENNPEPAEKLLERIKVERQRRYEKELIKWENTVKMWEKDGKNQKKLRKPKSPEFMPLFNSTEQADLKLLPHGWIWEKIGNITDLTSGQHILEQDYNEKGDGIPYLTGPSDFGDKYPQNTKWTTVPKAVAKTGDILITVKGSGVGKINMMNQYGAISRQLMSLNPFINKWYLYYFLQSEFLKFQELSSGTAIPGIGRKQVLNLPIPLISIEEQDYIIEKLNSLFSIIDNLEQTIISNLKKSEVLRQSILKKAFKGKLVEQDPTDEPASEFLKRIKIEKEKYLTEQKKLKKKIPKKTIKMNKNLSIEEVLKTSDKPMLAEDVWQQSKHKDNIEEFYSELKKIQEKLREVKKGTKSLLSLEK